MKSLKVHTLLSLLVLSLAAPVQAGDLLVSAAASLTNAFQEMKTPFEQAHPGTTVVFNFASSGALLKQMEQGAPVDVFASADQATMDKAAQFIEPETRVNFAGNALVMVVPAEGGMALKAPAELLDDAVRLVAIGNPDSVPAGRYARDALTAAGLYGPLGPKLVPAESVRQALDYVARGEVQAGFVYATDAALRAGQVKVAAEVAGHKPISYPIALLGDTKSREMGQAFIDFVRSGEGQAILAGYGFRHP